MRRVNTCLRSCWYTVSTPVSGGVGTPYQHLFWRLNTPVWPPKVDDWLYSTCCKGSSYTVTKFLQNKRHFYGKKLAIFSVDFFLFFCFTVSQQWMNTCLGVSTVALSTPVSVSQHLPLNAVWCIASLILIPCFRPGSRKP